MKTKKKKKKCKNDLIVKILFTANEVACFDAE